MLPFLCAFFFYDEKTSLKDWLKEHRKGDGRKGKWREARPLTGLSRFDEGDTHTHNILVGRSRAAFFFLLHGVLL